MRLSFLKSHFIDYPLSGSMRFMFIAIPNSCDMVCSCAWQCSPAKFSTHHSSNAVVKRGPVACLPATPSRN